MHEHILAALPTNTPGFTAAQVASLAGEPLGLTQHVLENKTRHGLVVRIPAERPRYYRLVVL